MYVGRYCCDRTNVFFNLTRITPKFVFMGGGGLGYPNIGDGGIVAFSL